MTSQDFQKTLMRLCFPHKGHYFIAGFGDRQVAEAYYKILRTQHPFLYLAPLEARGVTKEWGSEDCVIVMQPTEFKDSTKWANWRRGMHFMLAQESLLEVYVNEFGVSARFIDEDADASYSQEYTHEAVFHLNYMGDAEGEDHTAFHLTAVDRIYMTLEERP